MKNSSGNSAPDRRSNGTDRETGVLCRPAEEAFRKGLNALRGGETAVARALFEAAIKLERRSGANKIQPRYLSYYGLTLMEDPTRRPMALDCCRRAVKDEFFNAVLFLNLSRVYLRLGNRAEAHKAAMRGLALEPKHSAIQQHLSQMGVRGRPTIPFLDRSNFLNVTLGRMFRKGPSRSA
jgi:tetratricopeptide (TPR) repeat protein